MSQCFVSWDPWCNETFKIADEDPIPLKVDLTLRMMMPIICVWGTISNIFIVIIMAKQNIGSIRILFISLAISDTIFLICVPWESILILFQHTLNDHVRDFYHKSHWVVMHFINFSKKISIYATLLMTVERYMVVCKPLKFKPMSTFKTLFLLLIAASFSLSYTLGTRWNNFNWELSCDVCTGLMRPLRHWRYAQFDFIINGYEQTLTYESVYDMSDWFVEFILPWISLVVMNSLIIRTLRKARETRNEMSTAQTKANAEAEVTRCLLVVVVLYFFLELPRNLIGPLGTFQRIVRALLNFRGYTTLSDLLTYQLTKTIGAVFSMINSSVNLYIYVLTGRRFRETFLGLFKCCCKSAGKQGHPSSTVSTISATATSDT